MGKGAKIAIGCGIAVVVVGIVIMAVIFGGVYWAKGKVQQVAEEQKKIEELQKKANANAFTRPEDGVIQEDRLVKFLEVRKHVHAVYEKHKADIEAMGKKDKGDLSDVRKTFNIFNELRLAHAHAQADIGMSDDEYRFMVESVYKTAWASEFMKSSGGKTYSEATEEAMRKSAEQLKESEAKAGEMPEEARKALAQAREQMEGGAEEAREAAAQMDVPAANVELFKKYEADIKKYSMSGLELIGL